MVRWTFGYVRAASCSLHVLLAKILLVRFARRNCAIGPSTVETLERPSASTGKARMSVSLLQTAQLYSLHVKTTVIPHWLARMGLLGLFSVSVIDSSVFPLPLPGALTCCFCGLWRTGETHGCWRRVRLWVVSWAGIRRGKSAEKAARQLGHCVPVRLLRRVVR